jgi:hypothetical protein
LWQIYDGLLTLLAARYVLHLYFLKLDGRKIAGAFRYVEDKNFHYAKTGYDQEDKAIFSIEFTTVSYYRGPDEQLSGKRPFSYVP